MANAIKVAADVSKGILVHAKGNPAQIVAVGAAAAVAAIGVGIGIGAYEGAKWAGAKVGGLLGK